MLGMRRTCLAGTTCDFDDKHKLDITVLQAGLFIKCRLLISAFQGDYDADDL